MRVPNVKYNAKQLSLQPRLAWRGAMQVHPHSFLPYLSVYLYKQPLQAFVVGLAVPVNVMHDARIFQHAYARPKQRNPTCIPFDTCASAS